MDLEGIIGVTDVHVLSCCVVELHFADGARRVLDLEPFLTGPVFRPLVEDYGLFWTVTVDAELGTIVWPNGADISPRTLRLSPRREPHPIEQAGSRGRAPGVRGCRRTERRGSQIRAHRRSARATLARRHPSGPRRHAPSQGVTASPFRATPTGGSAARVPGFSVRQPSTFRAIVAGAGRVPKGRRGRLFARPSVWRLPESSTASSVRAALGGAHARKVGGVDCSCRTR